MFCCLASALMAGNVLVASKAGFSLLRRHSIRAAMILAGLLAAGIAIMPAVAEHAGHYAARAEANHRSVLAEILAAPLCSGEAQS